MRRQRPLVNDSESIFMMQITSFYKYQSLGNDFILVDWTHHDSQDIVRATRDVSWPRYVQKLCDRHFGVGADGILFITRRTKRQAYVTLFNSDGTFAERCLNGIRCVAHYLYRANIKTLPSPSSQHLSTYSCDIIMGGTKTRCNVVDQSGVIISSDIGCAQYQGKRRINILGKTLNGYLVNVGNPHFVLLKKTTVDWLTKHGARIERHATFPHRTNVEFVSEHQQLPADVHDHDVHHTGCLPSTKTYDILIYERGCGITLACGTGAAAVLRVLYEVNYVQKNEVVRLQMLGGFLETLIDQREHIIPKAGADLVYQAEYVHE